MGLCRNCSLADMGLDANSTGDLLKDILAEAASNTMPGLRIRSKEVIKKVFLGGLMAKAPRKKTRPQQKNTSKKKPLSKPASRAASKSLIREGQSAPLFSLPDESGKSVSLKDLRGTSVVLYFYPKDLTPGCTTEACDFRDSLSQLKKSGAMVLGVSRDSSTRHQSFIEKYDLNFPLLADVDGKVCEAYGVWKEKSLYGRKFMGIERTTFVIDPQGQITKIFPKVKVNGHAQAVLDFLTHGH